MSQKSVDKHDAHVSPAAPTLSTTPVHEPSAVLPLPLAGEGRGEGLDNARNDVVKSEKLSSNNSDFNPISPDSTTFSREREKELDAASSRAVGEELHQHRVALQPTSFQPTSKMTAQRIDVLSAITPQVVPAQTSTPQAISVQIPTSSTSDKPVEFTRTPQAAPVAAGLTPAPEIARVNTEAALQTVPVQAPTPRTSDKPVEFTRPTQPALDRVVSTVRVNAEVAPKAVLTQTTMPRTFEKPVESLRTTQSASNTVVPTACVREVAPQNTAVPTPRASATVTSMPRTSDASVKFKPSTQPAQAASAPTRSMHAAVEVIKNYLSLPEKADVKLETQTASELTSVLPMSPLSGELATIQRVSPITHQEQSGSIPQAIKQQAEVLAVHDINAEASKETKVSLAWGGDQAVFISGSSETGYKLRTSDNQVKDILMSHGGEIPAEINSVESSIDKQPKERQSTNQYFVDDSDE